jgi:hypothetical protein
MFDTHHLFRQRKVRLVVSLVLLDEDEEAVGQMQILYTGNIQGHRLFNPNEASSSLALST